MRPGRFIFASLIVSSLVWWLNFSSDTGASTPTQINAGTHLIVEEGRLHILVTGGAGFIGSHAALLLMDLGHAVTVVDNLSRGVRRALETRRAT